MEIKKIPGRCPVCKNLNHPLAPEIKGDLCDNCFDNQLKIASPLICKKCNHFIMMVKPGVSPSGFEFKLGKVYTAISCEFCSPVQNLEIIEVNDYLKSKKLEGDNFLKKEGK